MPEIKFSCPHCLQHIQAEPGYAGMQITCPACKGALIVPSPAGLRSGGPSPVPVPPPRAATSSCPSCGNPLPRGAVLCTQCGHNLVTKQRLVAGQPAAPSKPVANWWETHWYKTAYPYVAALIVVLAILYFLGRGTPAVMLAFIGVAALYSLAAHIIVVVAAFKEGVGTGFLTLCIPIYALYFVFKVQDNDTLKIIYGVAVLINIAMRFVEIPVE